MAPGHVGTGEPVTAETMFHLASVSKPFVAWLPEFTLPDGRQAEVTARGLLSHSSGLPDLSGYGWHDPQMGDDALSEYARSLSGWRVQADPGSVFSYSDAGFELLGLLLSRVTGTTFENAARQQVLTPLGCGAARSCAARCPRTWPLHRTWGPAECGGRWCRDAEPQRC